MTAAAVCPVCRHLVGCICKAMKDHKPGCDFRRALALTVELACPHGFQACPMCDPCSCGLKEKVEGIK